MILVEGKTIDKGVIQIDGHHFENCVISNCVLVFAGGDFSWTNCVFTNNQLRMVGAAQKTLAYLQHCGFTPQVAKIEKIDESTVIH